jgi:hypothetical protein
MRNPTKTEDLPEGITRQKLSPFFWAHFTVDGLRHRFSTKKTTVEDALVVRQMERDKILRGVKRDPSKTTIQELCENYVAHLETLGAARGDYKPATAYITRKVIDANLYRLLGPTEHAAKNKIAAKLTSQDVSAYRRKRLQEGSNPYTVDKELGILRTAVNIGAASKPPLIDASIFPKNFWGIQKSNAEAGVRDGMITLEHFDQLLPHMPEWMSPMLITCLLIGVRKREARHIKRTQLRDDRHITLEALRTKSRKSRIAKFPMKAWGLVSAWEEKTRREYPKCPWLFHIDGEQIPTTTLDQTFARACVAAGLGRYRTDKAGEFVRDARRCRIIDKDIRWHDSRRGFTTMAGDLEGVTDTDRGRVAGQTAATIARYDKRKSAGLVADGFDKKLGVVAAAPAPTAPAVSNGDPEATLTKLKNLFEKGLMSEKVYEAKVTEVVAAI